MNEKLYNVAIGMPESLEAEAVALKVKLEWTMHARREFCSDRYGLPAAAFPVFFNGAEWRLVEAASDNGRLSKVVARRSVGEGKDLVLVIRPRGSVGRVITCWCNRSDDCHRTLDRSKYSAV